MTGAMDAAISGLQSHMTKMSVIGNNIANVNTTAYKSQRTVFETTIYSTLYGGSNGSAVTGGTNPSQIGYGTRVSSIDMDMSTGNFSLTGRPMDCMIDGDGFFLVGGKDVQYTIDANDPESLKALTLTRTGNFEFKADGYLSDQAGSVVYGFLCTGWDEEGNPMFSNQLVPICGPRIGVDENGDYRVIYPQVDENGDLTAGTGRRGAFPCPLDSISIDPATGRIVGIVKDTDEVVIIGYIAIGNVTNPNGVTQIGNSYYKAMDGAGSLTVTLMGGAETEAGITHIGNGLEEGYDESTLPSGSRVGSAAIRPTPALSPLPMPCWKNCSI